MNPVAHLGQYLLSFASVNSSKQQMHFFIFGSGVPQSSTPIVDISILVNWVFSSFLTLNYLVPEGRVELPPHEVGQRPERCVSTNFTTPALPFRSL